MDDQTDEIEAAIEEGRERSRERRNRLRPEEEESDDVVSNPDR